MDNQAATCHKFSCSSTLGLILTLGGKSFQCPLEGGTIQIDTVGSHFYLTGKAKCPPCSTACNDCPEEQVITSSPDAAPAEIPCGSRTLRSADKFIIHAVISATVLAVSGFI
ncbi:hypothetical protein CRM22_004213 [Opisthorchis felineus]|uniref:Uncharacterized protein n=1 Tax=Opisthorchis felineus TaxID=147828 RepID=A0A4S2M3M0_OPIFE|nr:hypothetical protein CRM22_004213 [Opisthorchis felineus]